MAGITDSELLNIVNESAESPVTVLLDRLPHRLTGVSTTLLVPVHLAAAHPETYVQVTFATLQIPCPLPTKLRRPYALQTTYADETSPHVHLLSGAP